MTKDIFFIPPLISHLMECIPSDKTLIMTLTQDNQKIVRSPAIRDTFSIHSNGVYNYVLKALNNQQFDEVYKILNQLKTIIRCVWKTMFTTSQYPDIGYLKKVSMTKQIYKPFYGNKVLTITPKTRELDSEVLVIIQRNLIPPFDYKIDNFTSSMWDKYLLIFDNILLSESIQYRKELKINRDVKLKELTENRDEISKQQYEQQHSLIIADYTEKIETLKQNYIFKIVNYLNWLYYNNENRDIAWSAVLLRLSVITGNKFHNEQIEHNEEEYTEFIRQSPRTTKRELLELYIAVLIYKYQFLEHSIISYDKAYIDTIIHYLTDTLPTFDEYISKLFTNIYENIPLLRLLIPEDRIMKYILETCLDKFSYKLKPLYDILCKYFTAETLTKFGITQRVNSLITCGDICKLFNKMSELNYDQVVDKLKAYDSTIIMDCFKSACLSDYGPYTKYVIQYMITRFNKQQLDNEIIAYYSQQTKLTKSVNSLYGLLMAKLSNSQYFHKSTDKITTLLEASNNQPDDNIKSFILSEAQSRLTKARGYDKFQLENIIENIK